MSTAAIRPIIVEEESATKGVRKYTYSYMLDDKLCNDWKHSTAGAVMIPSTCSQPHASKSDHHRQLLCC